MKLTYGDVKATIARVINKCATDSRVLTTTNEAVQRLIARGPWQYTRKRLKVCVTNACVTWPRQVEAIEAAAFCRVPMQIRDQWYEYNHFGPGMQRTDSYDIDLTLLPRGDKVCTFDDPVGTDKLIQVTSDETEDSDLQILIKGYDENNAWIRTQVDGEWVDGEYVDIGTAGTLTTNYFTAITSVQKPVTNSVVRLWEYDTAGDLRALAAYESDETRPEYLRQQITGICPDNTDVKTIDAIAVMRFIPVSNDTDELMIGNIGALKLMAMAIQKEEKNLLQEAMAYEEKAVKLLEDELEHHHGYGEEITIQVIGGESYGAVGIPQIQ